MSSSPTPSSRRRALTLLGVLLTLGAVLVPSAAARAATGSRALQQATGYTASQLKGRPVCGAVEPGRIRCLAEMLTVKRNGDAVARLHVPHSKPNATTVTTAAPYMAGFLQSAYDTTWLSANNGATDTIAIVDAYGDSSAYSDMRQFRSANTLPQIRLCSVSVTTSCFEVVNQNGGTTSLPSNSSDPTHSWNIEESLDIDAVSSICPLCKIIVVEANSDDSTGSKDLETGVSTAARLGANQISLSWGRDVYPGATPYESPYNSIGSAAILAAAGDDSYPWPDVGYPAALSGVTAVGGTSLTSNAGAARGFSESAWSMQTCSNGKTCGTESGCDQSQSKPSYQNLNTDCSGRAYNDVSADADPNTGLQIYDSQTGSEGCGTASNWCIVGGTSLATPLTAALEAVAPISDTTPAWTYADAPQLNDVVSGSDGSCTSALWLLCNATTGWDGPTGNGSISGDVGVAPPGINSNVASGVNATDVTFTGGVYPNGSSTTYDWQYWIAGTSPPLTTPLTPSTGLGLQPSAVTLCGSLTAGATYDYDLTATNASGSTSGVQGQFTTPTTESAPTAAVAPTISGAAQPGQTLTAQSATWNDQDCDTSPSYQWQESSSPSGPWTTVSTSTTYALTSADLGQYLQYVGTESNSGDLTLTGTSASAVVGPVAVPAPSTVTSTTPTTTTTKAPPSTTVTETVRFYRCGRRCALINTHGATTYHPKPSDYGRYIKVVTTLTRTTNKISTARVSTRWVGPVTSSTAGAVSIGASARAAAVIGIRGRNHKLIAAVRIAKRNGSTLTLMIGRRGRATQVWAYVTSKGAVVSCTATHTLTKTVTLRLRLKAGQALKLVAVQT